MTCKHCGAPTFDNTRECELCLEPTPCVEITHDSFNPEYHAVSSTDDGVEVNLSDYEVIR